MFGERGLHPELAQFLKKLRSGFGPDVTRKDLRMTASAWCGIQLRQQDLTRMYNSAAGIPGVTRVRINGDWIFRNLILPDVEKRVEH